MANPSQEIPFEMAGKVTRLLNTWSVPKKEQPHAAQGLITVKAPNKVPRTFAVEWWLRGFIAPVLTQIECMVENSAISDMLDGIELGVLRERCHSLDVRLLSELTEVNGGTPTYESIRQAAIMVAGGWSPDWFESGMFLQSCRKLGVVPFCDAQFEMAKRILESEVRNQEGPVNEGPGCVPIAPERDFKWAYIFHKTCAAAESIEKVPIGPYGERPGNKYPDNIHGSGANAATSPPDDVATSPPDNNATSPPDNNATSPPDNNATSPPDDTVSEADMKMDDPEPGSTNEAESSKGPKASSVKQEPRLPAITTVTKSYRGDALDSPLTPDEELMPPESVGMDICEEPSTSSLGQAATAPSDVDGSGIAASTTHSALEDVEANQTAHFATASAIGFNTELPNDL